MDEQGLIGCEVQAMIRILLADHHEVVRRGLRLVIEQADPEWQICGEAANGREAVALAIQLKPDIAVLDLTMPELNGVEAIRQIRRELPDTEVLVFTLHRSKQTVRDALLAGARGYVWKSDPCVQFVAALEALVRHKPFFTADVCETMLDLSMASTRNEKDRNEFSPSPLTSREREIVQLLAEGRRNKEIATRLFISVKTVETHRAAIMRKLGAGSVVDLVHYAVRNELVHFD